MLVQQESERSNKGKNSLKQTLNVELNVLNYDFNGLRTSKSTVFSLSRNGYFQAAWSFPQNELKTKNDWWPELSVYAGYILELLHV